MVIHLTVGLLKNILSYKMSHFSEPYTCNKNKIKVEFHLSNYATKSDLDSLKSEIDTLDIDELKTAPVDLSKLSDLVKMKLLKRLHMMN